MPYYLWISKRNITYLVQWLKMKPFVDFSFQGFKCEAPLCLKEQWVEALKHIPFICFDYLTIVVH